MNQIYKHLPETIMKKVVKYFNPKPTALGRWGRDISGDQMIKRIDRANQDHCGPCGYDRVAHMEVYTKVSDKGTKDGIKNIVN